MKEKFDSYADNQISVTELNQAEQFKLTEDICDYLDAFSLEHYNPNPFAYFSHVVGYNSLDYKMKGTYWHDMYQRSLIFENSEVDWQKLLPDEQMSLNPLKYVTSSVRRYRQHYDKYGQPLKSTEPVFDFGPYEFLMTYAYRAEKDFHIGRQSVANQ